MKIKTTLGVIALISSAQAATINVGTNGFAGDTNNWPDGEPPSAAIDGQGQKYLNFGKFNTGVIVTPASGATTATSMTLWAANDSEGRDPASFNILGTNQAVTGDTFDSSIFTLIAEGGLSLPTTRNDGGAAELLASNSVSVNFANSESYTSYLVLFPTIKDPGENSMQVAEIQLFDAGSNGIFAPADTILGVQATRNIPEPSTGLLALIGMAGLIRRRR